MNEKVALNISIGYRDQRNINQKKSQGSIMILSSHPEYRYHLFVPLFPGIYDGNQAVAFSALPC
jgi:hypothetical protein